MGLKLHKIDVDYARGQLDGVLPVRAKLTDGFWSIRIGEPESGWCHAVPRGERHTPRTEELRSFIYGAVARYREMNKPALIG